MTDGNKRQEESGENRGLRGEVNRGRIKKMNAVGRKKKEEEGLVVMVTHHSRYQKKCQN